MRVARRRILRAVPAALFACALALGPAALAANDAITGTVVNGTTGEAVPGVEVTLHLFDGQSQVGSRTFTTDRTGSFSFSGLGPDAKAFQVTAAYAEAEYRTKVLPAGKPVDLTLKVYEPTTSPKDVAVTTWVVWVDPEGDGAAIQHDLEWRNSGEAAYVGSELLPDGTRAVVQVPLAPGAGNFQFLGTFLQTPGSVQGNTFVHTEPIAPGTSRATLRYTTGSLTELSFPVTLPTKSFQLFVPDGVTVVPGRLSSAGETTDRGITYQVFTASDLAAGDVVDVSLSGLSGGGEASPLTFVLIGVGAMAAIAAFVVWRLGRTRARKPARTTRGPTAGTRRPAAPQKGRSRGSPPRPTTRRARVAPAAPKAAPVPPDGKVDDEPESEEEDEAALLIDEIAALDLAYERGFLDQRTYQSLRTATKDRLLRSRSARTGGGPAK